jgi:hypothetical protein
MSAAPVLYRSRPTRQRRTKAEMQHIREAIVAELEAEHPMTDRQVFYRLVSLRVVDKTEAEYKQTVCRLLGEMRLAGEIPFSWIADNTRWMRKPRTYTGLQHFLELSAETYRRAVWTSQSNYVEVWLEKDALAGVLYQVTEEWDVPLMVTRGYASLSFLHSAAATIAEKKKPAYIYYLGDHDPSGVDIPRVVERRLCEFAPGADIHFETIAVTPSQIIRWDLPSRPTKPTDTRSKNFPGRSVEVDAIPPGQLRSLVAFYVQLHIDAETRQRLLAVEEAERETLARVAAGWGAS